MINLNALFRRRVEYYEYPWAIEGYVRSLQSQLRARLQKSRTAFVFSKSMPRSGHRFLKDCLGLYFGPDLHYCGFYRPDCCHRTPCALPYNQERTNHYFLQKSHDLGFRDSKRLAGKYLIQYRSPIPRLQSNYELHARMTGEHSPESFRAFAEKETIYFINFYQKWVTTSPANALAVAYEDLIQHQREALVTVIGFVQGGAAINMEALERTLVQLPVGGDNSPPGAMRDPMQHPYYDRELFARLERKVADACGTERIRFHFL